MTEEEKIAALWDIVGKLAKEDPLYDTGMGDTECIYCNGDNYSSKDFNHDIDCIITRARALIHFKEKG